MCHFSLAPSQLQFSFFFVSSLCILTHLQAQNHCRLLEQVLSETTTTTPDFSCFPAVFGRKLPSTSDQATASTSQAGGGHNKENLSPTSCGSSFRSPRNILSQVRKQLSSFMFTYSFLFMFYLYS